MSSELIELECQFQVKLSEKTRELVDRNYWATLTKLLSNNTQIHTKLPLPYELENVNWINTLFDFLAVESEHTGNVTAFELEFLIPDVNSFSTPATMTYPQLLSLPLSSLNLISYSLNVSYFRPS